MCLLCFSTEPLRQDEINKGKYGNAYGQFISETDSKFQTTLCKAPCAAPGCWCTSMICCCCSQMIMRHKVLNNVNPGSGWSDYKCCQGFYGGCCCLQPGKCGEKACPVPCLCLEVCCCAGPAVSATSMVMRRQYHLGLDKDDVRLIRCNNCIFMVSCLLSCLTICIQSDTLDCAAHCANITSDIVFCCTSGCMLAQAYNECKYRDPNNSTMAPSANEMER